MNIILRLLLLHYANVVLDASSLACVTFVAFSCLRVLLVIRLVYYFVYRPSFDLMHIEWDVANRRLVFAWIKEA